MQRFLADGGPVPDGYVGGRRRRHALARTAPPGTRSMTADRGQPTVALGQAGAMPLVGLGTWQMTGRAARRPSAQPWRGYRHRHRHRVPQRTRVGRAVRDSGIPREQVFVTTKLPPGNAGRERRTLAESLRALGMDHVNLWLVHRRRARPGTDLESCWPRATRAGRAGVSNYSLAQLDELIDATGQAPRSTRSRGRRHPRRRPAGRASPARRGAGRYSPFKNTDLRHPVLAEIAAHHGVTPPRWWCAGTSTTRWW